MSGIWVIGLGLAAGYLMQKNQNAIGTSLLQQAQTKFNSAAQPLLLPPGSERPKAAAKAKGGKGKKGAKKR